VTVEIEKISAEDAWEIFDAAARRLLRVSGEEFATRWDAGEYKADDDTRVMRVAMLRPSGR
jgi:hypothetical protein